MLDRLSAARSAPSRAFARSAPSVRLPTVHAPWLVLAVAALISAFAGIVGPLLVMHVYDKAIPNQNEATLAVLALMLAGILATDAIVRSARATIVEQVGGRYEVKLLDRLASAIVRGDIEWVRASGPGEHQARLAAIDTIKNFTCGSLVGLAVDLPMSAAALLLLAMIGGSIAVVPLAIVIAFIVPARLLGHRLGEALGTLSDVDGRRWSFVSEVLTNIHTTKALVLERAMLGRYERLMDGLSAQRHRVALLSGILRGLGDTLAQVSAVLTTGAGAYLVLSGELTLGELSACLLLSGRALQPILQSLAFWVQLQGARVAADQVAAGLLPPPIGDATKEPDAPADAQGAVSIAHVTIGSRSAEQTSLTDASLEIRSCETVAITGADQDGRAAIVQLLGGLLRPWHGSVMIDGIDAHVLATSWRLRNVAVVTERPMRFDGTLLDHLTWFGSMGSGPADPDLLHELLITQDVDTLPKGWATPVRTNEPQEDLMQRVALARALLAKPRLLILADTPNAFDRRGDQCVLQALARRRRQLTIVIVTHRPSYLDLADRVVDVIDGKLVERRRPPARSP